MENELSAAQNAAYDYRRCARVWQRVDPTLDPYPDVRAAAAMAADTPGDGLSAAERNAELTLPGAQADPCCMGTAALESLEVLQGFIREELADRMDRSFPRAARADGGGAAGVPRHRVGRGDGTPGVFSPQSISSRASAIAPRSAILRCAATATAPHCGSGITRRSAAASTIAAPRRKRSTPAYSSSCWRFRRTNTATRTPCCACFRA